MYGFETAGGRDHGTDDPGFQWCVQTLQHQRAAWMDREHIAQQPTGRAGDDDLSRRRGR